MNRRHLLSSMLGATAALFVPVRAGLARPALPAVTVYKSPTCGCCTAWVEHMEAAGFAVVTKVVSNVARVRRQLRMPDAYGSCHTATVGGYALEGHVPATEVKRLLAQGPLAVGLAVPGMPASSPGMDVPGRQDPYEVLLVERGGASRVFARYPRR